MYEWRVTKYDPRQRDGGIFRGDDWTSADDIGRYFGGVHLDLAAYLRAEDAYLAVAMHFLAEAGLSSLEAVGLETAPPLPLPRELARLLADGPPVVEHQHLVGDALERACRLNLRSLLWCRLERSGVFFLHFGYDYYMYVGSAAPCQESVRFAGEIGLFVEAMPSPYHIM